MREEAERLRRAGYGGAMNAELLAAKLVGRWPSGDKLAKSGLTQEAAARDPGGLGAADVERAREISEDDFANDPYGDGCPLFSHVRRAYPRDSHRKFRQQPAGTRRDEDNPSRHRLIRRGIPYTTGDGQTRDQGLLFLAYQASIKRQFEHVQVAWLRQTGAIVTPQPQNVGDDKVNFPGADPFGGEPTVVYYHRPGTGSSDENFTEISLKRFVTATGGGYFFAPSVGALEVLAASI
jgi:hypothetical protein